MTEARKRPILPSFQPPVERRLILMRLVSDPLVCQPIISVKSPRQMGLTDG
jgi:hypothetical protein